MEEQKIYKKNRGMLYKLFIQLLVLLLAASICLFGSLILILKSPYNSYKDYFVQKICTESRLGFLVNWILGEEEVSEILGKEVQQ